MMAGGLTVTEDTPPDMLAGSMDLTVVLPDRHSLKMSVERSTPMMDLLVQVTTANKMSPAGFILKPLNDRGPLPYKPSTPIGALDAWTIHVVPKQLAQCPAIKKPLKLLNQPFEQTFRLQVHLPRNQLYVARVSPKTRLSDILLQVCSEKNLDPLKYSLRHPINLDQVLSLHYTLGDYKLQELTLVCNKTRPVEVSSVDIMSLQRETSNPAYRNTKCEGSVSSGSLEGRSLSPVPSDESSASPPPLPLPPSRPIRKRRPAPKPPTIVQKPIMSEKQVNGIGIQQSTVINHSRNSSDSSGYHEASVLSESPQNNSIPESRKVASVTEAPLTATLSQSMTDVSAIPSQPPLHQSTSSNSISSLSSGTGRKKKIAPPPPPVAKDGVTTMRSPSVSSTASSTTTLDGNEANATVKSSTLPPSTRLNTALIPPAPPVTPPPTPSTPPVAVEPSTTPREPDTDLRLADEEIDRIFSNATENHTSPENDEDDVTPMMSLPSPVMEPELQNSTADDQLDWEYRLPAPPTFRDETKSPSVTEFGTVTIGNLSDVVCSQTVKEETSNKTGLQNNSIVVSESKIYCDAVDVKESTEVVPRVNDTDDLMMRPLRKEIRSSSASSIYETEASKSSRSSVHSNEQEVINELSSTLNQRPNRININEIEAKQSKVDLSSRSTLDNFTITTYKDTKPLEVFEDDSIKSSVGEKRDKSKDDAVFRAPKPRVKEPNLSRTSSFSIENNPNGPVIKRSVSYVSLLAANMPRHSQPYRAHLQRHRSSVGPELDMWPRLRKTSSEVNIDKKDHAKENSLWQDDTAELQSVQVLRNILSRSQANLSSSVEETDNLTHLQQRNSPAPDDNVAEHISSSSWGRTQSEEESDKWKTPKPKFEHSASLGEEPPKSSYIARGPPSINLSTWSERPKQKVCIKNDGEYISGFGKKPTRQDVVTATEKKEESTSLEKTILPDPRSAKNEISLSVKNESYKLEGKSKSISDLSRIPIVRSVELKRPYTGNSFDQSRLKHVEIREDTYSKKSTEAEDASKQNGDERFVGVDSLARKFGVPQKRPVSEYFGALKYKDLHSNVGNKVNNKSSDVISAPRTTNSTSSVCTESDSISNALNNKVNSTLEVKAQAKIRSGGFVENPAFMSTLKRTVSQPSHINLLTLNEPAQNSYSNVSSGSKPSNVTSVSISSNVDQKTPSSSIYIKQSQTLDRKFPISLQPVVKGFRVAADSNASQTLSSSPITKDASVNSLTSSVNSNFPVHKASYNRTLSTPSISVTSTSVKESGRENSALNNVRLRSSVSSISQAKAELASSIPPPPPMMPVLKPVGERKGIKLLPPPTADPRDLLMESIRSFGVDSLKKVSTVTKSSDK